LELENRPDRNAVRELVHVRLTSVPEIEFEPVADSPFISSCNIRVMIFVLDSLIEFVDSPETENFPETDRDAPSRNKFAVNAPDFITAARKDPEALRLTPLPG
jgi:hypothetical protein